ncbi:MAG: FtsX-like permease family protein [Dehalococcoidia bacterium]
MKLYQVVVKDVIRRKRRVLYATIGVIIGTATVVGILTVASAGQARIYNQLEKYGPNLAVIPAINNLDMKLGDVRLGMLAVGDNYISEEKLPLIRQIADGEIRKAMKIEDEGNIATIAPNLYINTKIGDTSVMVVGIDPQEEIKIKTWWKVHEGKYLEQKDQALVGAIAAEILKLNIGDVIPLDGTNVTVAGILEETGSNDDYQVFVPIDTLQKASGREGLVSSVDIRALCNACPVETIADGINKDIPGVRAVAVKQIAATEMGMMEKMSKFMLTLAGITLAVGLFGVVNTMMTSVNERIKDIGIMRAVGASRSQIVKAFIYEAIIIGIIGGILGYIVGTLLAYIAGPLVFEGTTIALVPQYFALALVLAIAVAVIATVYPAFRATQIKVADSFRSL